MLPQGAAAEAKPWETRAGTLWIAESRAEGGALLFQDEGSLKGDCLLLRPAGP